jgi:hypothetical protein
MDNLDEVIIIKNEKGIQYVNKKGFEIIDSIQFTNLEKQIIYTN